MERLNNTNMEPQNNNEVSMGSIVRQATAEFNKGQDTVHEIPTPKHSLLKTTGALVTAATIGLGGMSLAGCDQIQKTTFTTVDTSEKPSVTPTEAPTQPIETKTTAKPTEVPTATPTPTEAPLTPEQQEEKDLQEKMNLAPDIEGAEKVIKEINGLKRVTYERNGEYIGEYKKEVSQIDENGKATEVGGIALIGSEAEKLLNEKIPTSKNGYLMALAADISDLKTLDKVELTINSRGMLVEGPYCIEIFCSSNQIDVTNVIPGKTSISQSFSPSTSFWTNQSQLNWDVSETDYSKKMEFITVFVPFISGTATVEMGGTLSFGDKLGRTERTILETMGCANVAPDFQSFDNILTVDKVLNDGTVVKVPVFAISE